MECLIAVLLQGPKSIKGCDIYAVESTSMPETQKYANHITNWRITRISGSTF